MRATLFCVADLAGSHANLLREAASQGHEIASHGLRHLPTTARTADELRDDIRRAKGDLENAIGSPVEGFRAPLFLRPKRGSLGSGSARGRRIRVGFELDAPTLLSPRTGLHHTERPTGEDAERSVGISAPALAAPDGAYDTDGGWRLRSARSTVPFHAEISRPLQRGARRGHRVHAPLGARSRFAQTARHAALCPFLERPWAPQHAGETPSLDLGIQLRTHPRDIRQRAHRNIKPRSSNLESAAVSADAAR